MNTKRLVMEPLPARLMLAGDTCPAFAIDDLGIANSSETETSGAPVTSEMRLDVDGDGVIHVDDAIAVVQSLGSREADPCDVDGNGLVTPLDVLHVVRHLIDTDTTIQAPLAGTDSPQVTQVDVVRALQAGKYLANEATIEDEGDWNHDGLFDQMDVVFVLQRDIPDAPAIVDECPANGTLDEIAACLTNEEYGPPVVPSLS